MYIFEYFRILALATSETHHKLTANNANEKALKKIDGKKLETIATVLQ